MVTKQLAMSWQEWTFSSLLQDLLWLFVREAGPPQTLAANNRQLHYKHAKELGLKTV
jgi:hypothetical protein